MAQRRVVIVVDDDASLLKSVARMLAQYGFESRTFSETIQRLRLIMGILPGSAQLVPKEVGLS
ncbi:hypothetical protein [Bradyrhizobium canariense]|uniref:hypothetical protein n=1 Tax=Bradyrhizobium canariense TaxID=255045 RepID=UPI001FDACB17|nr:hypothetical protein [Bradyrhizobium canariense]